MSSVFDQAFLLSQAICDVVIENGINKLGILGQALLVRQRRGQRQIPFR
jgi:hypothetical protein